MWKLPEKQQLRRVDMCQYIFQGLTENVPGEGKEGSAVERKNEEKKRKVEKEKEEEKAREAKTGEERDPATLLLALWIGWSEVMDLTAPPFSNSSTPKRGKSTLT
jgi:hypothetical protein